ncbi:MAG: hypothetical protein BWY28_01158 [bacterium ADurb.Bin236]|nr:MAG: hypothetical protein BWY28_01158 [bacterium ADurb.Bin236]
MIRTTESWTLKCKAVTCNERNMSRKRKHRRHSLKTITRNRRVRRLIMITMIPFIALAAYAVVTPVVASPLFNEIVIGTAHAAGASAKPPSVDFNALKDIVAVVSAPLGLILLAMLLVAFTSARSVATR